MAVCASRSGVITRYARSGITTSLAATKVKRVGATGYSADDFELSASAATATTPITTPVTASGTATIFAWWSRWNLYFDQQFGIQ